MGKGSPRVAVDVTQIDTSVPTHALGQRYLDEDGEYMYVKFNGTIAAGAPVVIDGDGTYLCTAAGATSEWDGLAVQAQAAATWGWILVRGYFASAQVNTAAAASALIARLTDSNGDFIAVVNVNLAGTDTAVVAATFTPAGKFLAADTAGVGPVFLW